MNLKIQIISLIFSFFYGVFFSVLVNYNYNLLFAKVKIVKVTITSLFVVDMALLYFLILRFINSGIVHIYFLILILLGFYSSFPFFRKFRILKLKEKEKEKKDK